MVYKKKQTLNGKLIKLIEQKTLNIDNLKSLLKNKSHPEAINSVETPVLIATMQYDLIEEFKCLIKHGANVESRCINGDTALIRAAINGNKEIVKLLLEYGANIEAKDQHGRTALDILYDKDLIEKYAHLEAYNLLGYWPVSFEDKLIVKKYEENFEDIKHLLQEAKNKPKHQFSMEEIFDMIEEEASDAIAEIAATFEAAKINALLNKSGT